ncbi:MAG: TlpA family protein disulfide reductase [Nitrospiria bacterium]
MRKVWYTVDMAIKKSVFIFILFFPLIISFEAIQADEARQKAPPFELVSLKGEKVTQEDLIGKVTLLVFWASWCGTCQSELPKIARLQKELEGKPFQVYAIGFKDTRKNIRRYVKSHRKAFPFPAFYDTQNRVSRRFGARVTPTLFLFDKKGELVVPFQGGGLLDHPQFRKVLEDIL